MQQARRALHAKLLRSLTLAAAVVAYVKGRRWLAGDDLVRIYRKVLCPLCLLAIPCFVGKTLM